MKPLASILFLLCVLCASARAQSPQTYFIDYTNGADSNNGLSTNAPWKHHPYMPVPGDAFTGSYTHQAGDRFIFRGGVVWPYTCFNTNDPGSPHATFVNGMALQAGGSPTAWDYYGVQSNWFVRTSFTRPVFDGGYIASTLIYVDSVHNGASNLVFDCLELRHVNCINSVNCGLFYRYCALNVVLSNSWLHGWTLTNSYVANPYNVNMTNSVDGAHGGDIGNYNGSVPWDNTGVVCDHVEIENSEQYNANGTGNGVCQCEAGTDNYCSIHDNSTALINVFSLIHCTMSNIAYPYSAWDQNYHLNGWGDTGVSLVSGQPDYCINNIFHDIGCNVIFPAVCANVSGPPIYIYNNLVYNNFGLQGAIDIDIDSGTGLQGSVYVYNNTIVVPDSITNHGNVYQGWSIGYLHRVGDQINNFFISNNFIISTYTTSPILTPGASTWIANEVEGNNLILTTNVANADGYNVANGYAPTSSSSPTVGAGANLTSLGLFNADIVGKTLPASGAWDAGAYLYTAGSQFGYGGTNFHGLFLRRP